MNYTFKNIFISLFLLTISLHSNANDRDNVHVIPFIKASGLILIEAEIDGHKGNLIFDTGADGLLINNKVSGEGTQDFQSLDGVFSTGSINISHLTFGSYTVNGLKAYKTDLSQLESFLGNNILGVIGAKVLKAEVLRIDNVKKTIELIPKSVLPHLDKSQNHSCPLYFDNDIPIIEVKIDGMPYLFALDTGSSTSFIDSTFFVENMDIFQESNNDIKLVTASTNSSSIDIYVMDEPIDMAKVKLEGVRFALFDFEDINTAFNKPLTGILSIDNLPLKELFMDYLDEHIYFLF